MSNKIYHDFDNGLTRLKMMAKLIRELPKEDLPESLSEDANKTIEEVQKLWKEIEQTNLS